MRSRTAQLLALFLSLPFVAYGWGWNAHRFINRTAVRHLPPTMGAFIADSLAFAAHAHDADARRVSGDTSLYAEGPRHYLDIDDYPDFRNLPRNLDTLIARFGWERVKQNGISPWALLWCYDSLVAQLVRNDASRILLTASDLGHYIGDITQPLHNTVNYDGQFTGNSGIHSRYETTMLSPSYYLGALFVTPGVAGYIPDPLATAFEEVLRSNSLVPAVLGADVHARQVSGWTGSGSPPAAYYHALWDSTNDLTLERIGRASFLLGSLWFSAWVDAGRIVLSADPDPAVFTDAWRLDQNFPNPFNPATKITFGIPSRADVTVVLHDILGREVARPLQAVLDRGDHAITIDGAGLSSGVYFLRLIAAPADGTPPFAASQKIILVR